MFPELAKHLQNVWDAIPEGTKVEYFITRYRTSNVNLRTQLLRFIERAKVEPWPRLFQNLRATRQTELSEFFPAHVVCSWLGNSEDVAKGHYMQCTDAHYDVALQPMLTRAQK